MTDETKKDGITITQEDIDSINADIASAKKELGVVEPVEQKEAPSTDSLKEEIKAQIMAEMKAEAEAKAKEQKQANLQSELERQKQLAEEKLSALQAKVDDLTESKAVVNVKSPFLGEEKNFEALVNDKEKIKAIDDASREAFFKERG